jgi:pseudaminic acid biosynthesis-associated methylase
MSLETNQVKFWSGDFGKEYTDRNPNNVNQMDELYIETFGVNRQQMNVEFLNSIPKNARILEVGCNVGVQLQILQKMGFTNLYGIEIQSYAVEKAKSLTKNINIIQGSGFDIPFKDNYFDLVYTSGVLIHISPADLTVIMKEISRCSNSLIWGFEYFSEKIEDIKYRENTGFLWKANYAQLYLNTITNLTIIKEKHYNYINQPQLKDSMFLIKSK